MPRLPKGMFKRKGSNSYYIRAAIKRKEVWRSLGPDFQEAVRRFRLIESEGGLRAVVKRDQAELSKSVGEPTVSEIGEKWLSEYIATRRNEQGKLLAKSRFKSDILPAIGKMKVSDVKPERVTECCVFRLESRVVSLPYAAVSP